MMRSHLALLSIAYSEKSTLKVGDSYSMCECNDDQEGHAARLTSTSNYGPINRSVREHFLR